MTIDRLPGPKSPSDLTNRRKELAYADSYAIFDGMTAFSADPVSNETDLPVFGNDSNIQGTNTTGATVSLTLLEQNEKSNGFLRLIHGAKPSKLPLDDPKQYKATNIQAVNLLVLRKDNDDTKIIASRFWPNVVFSESWPTGGPDDKAQRVFSGKGGVGREFDGLVTHDLIESGGGAAYALRNLPVAVDRETAGTYAVYIEALYAPGGDLASYSLQREAVDPTPAMVNNLGEVSWSAVAASCNEITNPSHVSVYYLTSGVVGIPTTLASIAPEGIRGSLT